MAIPYENIERALREGNIELAESCILSRSLEASEYQRFVGAANVHLAKKNLEEGVFSAIEALCQDYRQVDAYVVLIRLLIESGRYKDALIPLSFQACLHEADPLSAEWDCVLKALSIPEYVWPALRAPQVAHIMPALIPHGPDMARLTFKVFVKAFEFELSSFCNRKCSYCPNSSSVDRITNKAEVDSEVFEGVVNSLRSINYDGSITLNRFNEPLVDPDFILPKIRHLRRYLPKSRIVMFSNGDFLTRDYLMELEAAGVSEIVVSRHIDKKKLSIDERFMFGRKSALALMESVGLVPLTTEVEPPHVYRAVCRRGALDIVVLYNNWTETGTDRGGSTQGVAVKGTPRMSHCVRPLNVMSVGYEGSVSPCCNILTDYEPHKAYLIGKIRRKKVGAIFEIYGGEVYSGWRRSLYDFSEKKYPCDTCTMALANYNDDLAREREIIVAMAEKLTLI